MTRGPTPEFPSAMLVLVVLAALAACASAPPGADSALAVSIRVDNDLISPTVVTVHATESSRGAARRLLGTVQPSATAVLRFDPIGGAGQYVLVARTTAGREIASNPFVADEGDTVLWRLSSNIATVER